MHTPVTTAEISYPWGETLPAQGNAMELAPGVKWIRMALPFALNHINLWLLRDRQPTQDGVQEGWTVVDCCIDSATSRSQWESIFATALEGLPILRVIVTHMHPDHIGLAHWLCERWQAPLWISATDYHVARAAIVDPDSFGGPKAIDFYRSHGVRDAEFMVHMHGRSSYYRHLVPALPLSYRRMIDGDTLRIGDRVWHCIDGYGHAPEHIALHCPEMKLLISGDMVLPRISTNVSVHAAEPEGNPLRLFLQSLQRYPSLAEDTLTLPSHGKPFHGLHVRIQQLMEHHQDRLEEVVHACQAGPKTAADIVTIMFTRQLDAHQMTFAQGEALAHLHLLWQEGRLQRLASRDGFAFLAKSD